MIEVYRVVRTGNGQTLDCLTWLNGLMVRFTALVKRRGRWPAVISIKIHSKVTEEEAGNIRLELEAQLKNQ